jgi:hypothetical protein
MAMTIAQALLKLEGVFKKYQDAEVRAGYMSGASYNDGTSLADVASKHERGAGVPLRAFITKAFLDNRENWRAGIKRAMAAGKSVEDALALCGMQMTGDIKRSITGGGWGRNSAKTIRRKGFDRPLVDTGTMLKSPEYEVIIGGKVVYSAYSAQR